MTLICELDLKDLVSLVKGSTPNYSLMTDPLIADCGEYIGGFVDKWSWLEYKLKTRSEEELWTIYQMCKKSWEKRGQDGNQ